MELRTSVAKSSSLISVRATPTTTSGRGSWSLTASDASAGKSLRWARSPVAPKTTNAVGAGRPSPSAAAMRSAGELGSALLEAGEAVAVRPSEAVDAVALQGRSQVVVVDAGGGEL